MSRKSDKKLPVNTERLRSLIATYGMDAVMSATGYTAGSLTIYTSPSGAIIPDSRLDIATRLLKAEHPNK